MEKGAAGGDVPAREAGSICDRFLTFLTNSLHMNRQKNITDGPRSGGAGGGYRPLEEEDEFAIRIERAEFEFSDHGDAGHAGATTVLGDATTVAATASDELQQRPAAAADPPVAAAAEETKIRKTVTIKEDQPEEASGAGGKKGAPALERKKSLFKKRQASSSSGGAGEEQGGKAPRRSGLWPRMPAVLRVPSNINERSSTFIEERRKSFGTGGKAAAPANK
ncbi:hypothetical protein EJB05_53789, partial [Eragrostis curvula]